MNRTIREVEPLQGLRREMSREEFERLCALQCRIPQLLGWCGVRQERLERWVRRIYGLTLEEAVEMVRQDGLVEIREAAFELMKKNASLVNQQQNRFLAVPDDAERDHEAAVQTFAAMLGGTDEESVEEVFR